MTTLVTGLAIQRSKDDKMPPALRQAVQRATSVYQKDYCYDLLQSLVDDPEIADPIGIRIFLNFCLRQPDTLIDSFLDAIDQNVVDPKDSPAFILAADNILDEVEHFIEFIHGLIELIDSGVFFKLSYHEIDAWKLSYKLLDPIQRRLFDLAVHDRQRISNHHLETDDQDIQVEPSLIDPKKSASTKDIELTFASDSTSSGFYQAFVAIDKFLKHSFESRVLLEPAKLVEDLDELNERKNELITFRTMFPVLQSSGIINKKYGRFGREEAAIEHFLESDKFKELSKLKSQMSGGQLTRQPSTRAKKKPTAESLEPSLSTQKRSVSVNSAQVDHDSGAVDSFSPPAKMPLGDGSDSDSGVVHKRRRAFQPGKPSRPESNGATPLASKKGASRTSLPGSATSTSSRKRKSRSGQATAEKEESSSTPLNSSSHNKRARTTFSASKRASSRTRKPAFKPAGELAGEVEPDGEDDEKDENEDEDELFVIDKIIGESVDINGETIYQVLWAGYPESDATWQFANTLDDCAALDVWQEQKKKQNQNGHRVEDHTDQAGEEENVERVENGENGNFSTNNPPIGEKSPAALVVEVD